MLIPSNNSFRFNVCLEVSNFNLTQAFHNTLASSIAFFHIESDVDHLTQYLYADSAVVGVSIALFNLFSASLTVCLKLSISAQYFSLIDCFIDSVYLGFFSASAIIFSLSAISLLYLSISLGVTSLEYLINLSF
jgi:hypothetical protein